MSFYESEFIVYRIPDNITIKIYLNQSLIENLFIIYNYLKRKFKDYMIKYVQ